jgi:hypothetical protein
MSGFDPQMDPTLFLGEFTRIRVVDPAAPGPPMVGNLVIDPAKDFDIEVEWNLKGFFVPLWLAALGGNWVIEAYAESVGPGQEKMIASKVVPVGTPVQPKTYSEKLRVSAGQLQEHTPGPAGPSGVYKLTVTAFLNSTLGTPGYDIAGFVEGPVIRAENPI